MTSPGLKLTKETEQEARERMARHEEQLAALLEGTGHPKWELKAIEHRRRANSLRLVNQVNQLAGGGE